MTFLMTMGIVLVSEVLFAFLLSAIRRAGSGGARLHEVLCRAPMLDVIVGLMTLAPPIVGAIVRGWIGVGGAMVGQILGLVVWVFLHELVHREASRGPRLVKAQNRAVGMARNHLALWVSVLALPIFWMIRVGETVVYPLMRLVLPFPKYRQGDWVNISRHKFDGLVGHDLIWCLYCDWMTGVYSLGAEMLRNIESFWCPIRFYDGKKCDHCKVDFPDVETWSVPDGTLAPSVEQFNEYYGDGTNLAWFGHPTRLTVEGAPVEARSDDDESKDD